MAYRHLNHKSVAVYAVALLAAYALTMFLQPGWGTYAIALPAYLIVGLTCFARANAIVGDDVRHNVRRFGFTIMTGLEFMLIVEPIFGSFPRWPRVFGNWALVMIWMTTEGLPPWWELITGQWKEHAFLKKLKLFLKLLHGSKP